MFSSPRPHNERNSIKSNNQRLPQTLAWEGSVQHFLVGKSEKQTMSLHVLLASSSVKVSSEAPKSQNSQTSQTQTQQRRPQPNSAESCSDREDFPITIAAKSLGQKLAATEAVLSHGAVS